MAVIKNEKTGKWEVRTYYEDWTGERKQKTKRGFEKKQDAVEWERAFKLQKHYDMSMTFSDFVEVYSNDMKPRLRLNTWNSKEHIIRTKILPYFKNKKMSEITPSDIVNWQNELLELFWRRVFQDVSEDDSQSAECHSESCRESVRAAV